MSGAARPGRELRYRPAGRWVRRSGCAALVLLSAAWLPEPGWWTQPGRLHQEPGTPAHDAQIRDEVRRLVAAGQLQQAVQRGQELESRDPAAVWLALRWDARTWLPEAGRWLRSGHTEDALWVFQVLADGEPGPGWEAGEAWALANLALTQRHLGWLEEARVTYEQALARAPLDPLLWNDWGLFLRGQGELHEALAAYRQSVAVDPDPAVGPALTNLVQLAVMHPDVLPEPPMDLLREGLARRPDGAMLRRLSLEFLAADRVQPQPAEHPAAGGGTGMRHR